MPALILSDGVDISALELLVKIVGYRRGQQQILVGELALQTMAGNLQYRDHVNSVFKQQQSKVKPS